MVFDQVVLGPQVIFLIGMFSSKCAHEDASP